MENVYRFISSLPGEGFERIYSLINSINRGTGKRLGKGTGFGPQDLVKVFSPRGKPFIEGRVFCAPGCLEIGEEFRSQEIDGQALLLLKEDHLMGAMNIKLGPALKIYAQICLLKDC